MKRATPSCSSIALLLRSSPPCAMLLTLTTANAVPLDDFGPPPPTAPSAFTNPPADPKAALDVLTLPPANQGAIVLPITGHQSAVRPDRRAVHPAGDPDVHLLELLDVPRKSEDW
jgi:hypothetical protein